MASFTDQIMQFRPYVQQLPTEAMAQVGMYKQQKYEEGVQKIQSYIDNIAGLDVVKPLHKQYLQSKLNELGSRLKSVAAGDFSNFQLVNSVGGMATQIVKDPTVQSAVRSTQMFRKGQSDMETARKAGKSAPENEWFFNTEFNNWMNDGNVSTQFNGQYNQYVDVDKKLRDLAEKIKEIDRSVDIPYKRDKQGNVIVDAKGNPSIDEAMLRVKTKGKPAEKILSNFYTSLDENDKRQLAITGAYHYRGATEDTFRKDILSNYNSQKKMLSDEIVNLSVELKTNDKLSASERSEITARINANNAKLDSGELDRQMQAELDGLGSVKDLNDYKYRLYSQKYLTRLAQDLSYQSYEQQYLNNPYFQADMELRNLDFKYAEARRQQANWNADFKLKVAGQEFEKYKFSVEQKQKGELGAPVVVPGALSTDVSKPSLVDLERDITGATESIKQLNSTYAPQLFGNLKGSEREKALNELFSQYKQNPTSVTDNAQREYLEKRRAFEMVRAQKQNLFTSVVENSKKFDAQIDAQLATEEPLKFANGAVLYTPKELYEVQKDLSSFYKTTGGGGGSMYTSPTTVLDTNAILTKYEGTKYAPIAKAFVKNYSGQPLTSVERSIFEKGKSLNLKYAPVVRKTLEDKLAFQSDYLATRMPERQTQIGTLDLERNKVDAGRVDQLIGTKFDQFAKRGALDVQRAGEFNPSTIQELRKNPRSTYTIEKRYDGTADLIISDGETRQIVPMTASEFSAFFPKYSGTHSMENVKYTVLSSPNFTTNAAGLVADSAGAVNAYFSGYDIPGLSKTAVAPLVRLDVEGSVNNTGGNNDKYQVRMYVNDNGVWKNSILNQKGYVTEDGIQAIIANIGTHTVDDLLKRVK